MNYSNLIQYIQDAAEDDGTEFVAHLADYIDKAERRLTKDIDSYGMVQFTSLVFTPSSPFLTKPTTMQVGKSLSYRNDAAHRINLVLRTNEFCNEYWPDRTSVGTPKYYSNWTATQWIVVPTPASANSVEVEMVARPTALSSINTTNWFTDFADEALFFASMVEACMFQKAYDAAAQWEQRYTQQLQLLRNEARRTRRDDIQIPANPAGGESNIQEGSR